MTLKQQLQQDLHQALRDRDAHRKSAIRLVRAAIANEEIARQCELDNGQVLELIHREVKQHRESLLEFEKAGRTDLVADEKAQLEVLLAYLPPQMGREEILVAAQEAIAEANATGPQHLGQLMRLLMPRLKGRADGKMVNEIVRELLSVGE
jgi:uncharacterized protein YqeY